MSGAGPGLTATLHRIRPHPKAPNLCAPLPSTLSPSLNPRPLAFHNSLAEGPRPGPWPELSPDSELRVGEPRGRGRMLPSLTDSCLLPLSKAGQAETSETGSLGPRGVGSKRPTSDPTALASQPDWGRIPFPYLLEFTVLFISHSLLSF